MERRSFSHRSVYIAFALSIAVGFVVALYIFTRFTTYDPEALRRVPEDADFVARLNVQQAVVQQPLRNAILPVLERGRAGPEPRRKHLERKTTLELDVDVRELVYAELPGARFLIIAAGFLRQDEVLDGVARMLTEEGIPFERHSDEEKGDVLVHSSGIAFGVASDGTLVVSSGIEEARGALQGSDDFPTWARPLAAPGMALSVFAAPRPRRSERAETNSHLEGGTFLVEADSVFPFEADLVLSGQGWTQQQVDALLHSKANDFSYLLPLSPLSFQALVLGRVRARGALGRKNFDESVHRLAERMEKTLDRSDVGRPR